MKTEGVNQKSKASKERLKKLGNYHINESKSKEELIEQIKFKCRYSAPENS